MNVLILGTRAREHALAWKLKQSPLVESVYVAPGNGGTSLAAENLDLNPSDHTAVIAECHKRNIELVIVGSDTYLAEGIVDALHQAGIQTFGPTRAAAEIEWSKAFAKEFMEEEGIPTARSRRFKDFNAAVAYVQEQPLPIVIKASGLADGKGVVIAQTYEEARGALEQMMKERIFGASGESVVVEEFLQGNEISLHALCVGEEAVLFPPSQDHKRAFDNDKGPNTGGMGSIVPVPGITPTQMGEIRERIIIAALRGLKRRGRPFNGLLYPSVMLTKEGPKVIEYNARFGDPETESYVCLLKTDLLPALLAVAKESFKDITLEWHPGAAACVVVASGGYPNSYQTGFPISGLEEAEKEGAVIFHAGTSRSGTELLTNGGRVLAVTAKGIDLGNALAKAYAAIQKVSFTGLQYRTDIGAKASLF